MKTPFSIFNFFIIAILLVGVFTILPQQSAYAKCGGPNDPPCPPKPEEPGKSDYSKKTKVPDPPTKTPVPSATEVSVQLTATLVDTNASCPPIPVVADNPNPPTPSNSSFFDIPPLIMGGGGTLLGILIGLLLGGVFGRSKLNGGLIAPTDGQGKLLPAVQKGMSSGGSESAAFDAFHKQGDTVGAYDAFHKQSDDVGAVDMFDKSSDNKGFDVFKKYKKADNGISDNMGKQDLNSIRESPISPDKSSLPGEDINGDLKL